MDFDLIEQLSPEEISELYNDIAEKNHLACDCHANGYATFGESEILFRVGVEIASSRSSCDAPENVSSAECRNWCNNMKPDNINEMIGGVHWAYIPELGTYRKVTMHSWDESEYFSFSYSFCLIPDDAECDWARMSGNGSVLRYSANILFKRHCNP